MFSEVDSTTFSGRIFQRFITRSEKIYNLVSSAAMFHQPFAAGMDFGFLRPLVFMV